MTEIQIALLTAGIVLAVFLLLLAVHILYRGLPDGKAKETLQKIIFEIDKHADQMENKEKRATAIQAVMDLLGWRRIVVPKILIGWLIDTEVAVIRKIQQATNTPNLNLEDENK